MAHEFHTVVRGYELDSFNHVNHAVYLNYLEQARWEVLRQSETFDLFRRDGLFLVVTEVLIRYAREAKLFDRLVVTTAVEEEPPYLVFHHEIRFSDSGRKVASGRVKSLLVDGERTPWDVPREILHRLKDVAPGPIGGGEEP